MRPNRAALVGMVLFLAPLPGRAAEDVATVRQLIKQLESGDRLARQDAAEALERFGPAAVEAIPALAAALRRDSTALPAAFALVAIGPEGWRPLLDLRSTYGAAWFALRHRGPRSMRLLVPELWDYYSIFKALADQIRLKRPMK